MAAASARPNTPETMAKVLFFFIFSPFIHACNKNIIQQSQKHVNRKRRKKAGGFHLFPWKSSGLNDYVVISLRMRNVKLVFGGQGPLPMRFGSVGSPVSTGAARNEARHTSVLNDKLVFIALK